MSRDRRQKIEVMTNRTLLKNYPDIVSKASGQCVQGGVGAYRFEEPRRCQNKATLHVKGRDLCSVHAKDVIYRELTA